ncbi:unnamed protein product [Nesidiocoris tenuis]|uniref:WD repeat-containing protein 7 n=1 Tax=Nesidiocoris tenuis TaxID=355587 RepID=A0A6H5H8U1_9HEMI|nr:unnamed protein product [Nesidiocoris tenuis]
MANSSQLVIPVVLWGKSPPTHCVSCVYLSRDQSTLITGCYDGQICLWQVEPESLKMIPRCLLVGHTAPILCLSKASVVQDNNYVVSSTESGEMCTWDLVDGKCRELVKLPYVHTSMQAYHMEGTEDVRLFCNGYYADILIMDPFSLEIIYTLSSRVSPDWISALHVLRPNKRKDDIVLALTTTGTVKVWTLSAREIVNYKPTDLILENESKVIKCLNALAMSCCSQNQRTVLIVTAKYWQPVCCPPAMRFVEESAKGPILIRADSEGAVLVWSVPQVTNQQISQIKQQPGSKPISIDPFMCTSIAEAWTAMNPSPVGILDQLENEAKLTASIFLPQQGRLVVGREDGTIIIVPATQTVMLQLLHGSHQQYDDWPPHQTLAGHNGRVNCLLYPYHVHPRYDKSHLVSGGVDFAVCLWDLYAGTLLHRFCVHAGEITQLLVPPNACSTRVQKCICSVASDHSVTLLSLTERKCVVLASRHLFPVMNIKWRPLDDFMIVGCTDGTVYVWQMETGHLDRVLHGISAEDVLYACDETTTLAVSSGESGMANPAVHFFRGLRHRNINAIRHATQRGLHQLQQLSHHNQHDDGDAQKPRAFPLMIQGLRTNPKDPESHILCFDIEALIDFFGKVKNKAGDMERILKEKDKHGTAQEPSRTKVCEANLTMEMGQLLLSLLHAWGLDPDLDLLCETKLGLLRPLVPVSFGVISKAGYMTLMLPTWQLCQNVPGAPNVDSSLASSIPPEMVALERATRHFTSQAHWELSTSITTSHLLAIIAIANTLMSMNNASFVHEQERSRKLLRQNTMKALISGRDPNEISNDETVSARIKQGWSLLATLHCVLLPDKVTSNGSKSFKKPQVEMMASRWQHHCVEVREAAQALLLAELSRLGSRGRKALVDHWAHYLPVFTQNEPHPPNPLPHSAAIPQVARFNTLAQNAQTLQVNLSNVVLYRAKPEILRCVELLIDKMHSEMTDLLVEVVEVILHCVEPGHLKTKPLSEVFPAICRFNQVSHCNSTRRIAVGGKNGSIALYELRSNKCQRIIDSLNFVMTFVFGFTQTIQAHDGAITANAFSPDGKFLVSYSCTDNKLSFWQTSSGMFGLGNSQTRRVKSYSTSPVSDISRLNPMRLAKLVWINNRQVTLMLADGSETRFNI